MSEKESKELTAEETLKKIAAVKGAAVGGAVGGAAVAGGFASIAGTAAAASTAAAGTPLAGTVFASFLAASVSHPATWALAVTNPIGQAVLVGGGTVAGGLAAYRFMKKALGEKK